MDGSGISIAAGGAAAALAGAWWLPLALAPLVGSFLGVLIARLPTGEPVILGRSRCPRCATRLAPRDLVPLLSWAWQRGRCRHCGARLGLFYPLVELAATLVAAVAVAIVPAPWVWPSCGLGWVLLTLACIDARHLILPDVLTLPLIPAGLAVAAVARPALLASHLAGALIGFALPWLLRRAYVRLRHREGLGLGDVKLLAAAGAWLGWQGLPGVLLLGAAAALLTVLAEAVIRDRLERDRPIPFGPFLCLAFWVSWLAGPLLLA